ncbi:unnamed protein product [Rotaria sordida]|uniref:G-protein coupled receptors family 1 profile domain-containing protein n=2 Tax=Rotaria sordida TaxID=392033 RepID=A0A815QVF4_9BILA|nr:unnamed protein product [Rotaria sordida]CAF1467045.1 unnamed protein product [Rotaria sordida]CAF3828647.1 unnamed protein product [Rotaria sordida]CAF4087543.1 unnamed protein product [Rotaria sordida]
MNSTEEEPGPIENYYLVCSLSAIFAVTAVAISITILIIVQRTKPRLHTVRHLLMCNTCIASILYCIVQTNNYIFLIFFPSVTSDISCRWRGYFSYITISAIAYSFLIQAISRLFIVVFSTKYKHLITFKTHYILIIIQWFTVIIIPIPTIITKDIYYRPNKLCWVPLKYIIHVSYGYIAYYTIPALSVGTIYIFIYYQVKRAKKEAKTLLRLTYGEKRDLELLRNIVILLSIYFMGGIPTLLFLVSSQKILYLMGIATISLTVAVEKLCTILLDQELRQVIRKLLTRVRRITPVDNTNIIARYRLNQTNIQQIIVQPLPKIQNTLF